MDDNFLLGELKGRLDGMESGIRGIQESVAAGFTRVEGAFSKHDAEDKERFNDLYSKINNMKGWQQRVIGIWIAASFIVATILTLLTIFLRSP